MSDPRPTIRFSTAELEVISRESGLSILELKGVLQIMNAFTYNDRDLAQWQEDEVMGRNIY